MFTPPVTSPDCYQSVTKRDGEHEDVEFKLTTTRQEMQNRQSGVGGCVGGRPDGQAEAILGRVLRNRAREEGLPIIDDQITGDVEGPDGWDCRNILCTGWAKDSRVNQVR